MSVMTLRESSPRAARVHHCEMCGYIIKVGERHHVSTNVYDGRVYDWRECIWCTRDHIVTYVYDWFGGYYDEGVNFDNAIEWADEAVEWPRHWLRNGRRIATTERMAARNWLARVAGGEGE